MIYEVIGWIGSGLVVLAYFLISTHKIEASSKEYQLLNLFGSLGILVNAFVHKAIPVVGLNSIWLLIALYGLAKAAGVSKKI